MPFSHHESADESNGHEPIRCPKCGEKAEVVEASGVVIDRCRACGGIWLDATEKEELLAMGAAKAVDRKGAVIHAPQGQKGAALCPRDRSMLIRAADPKQPHVQFESCTVCGGVFLDAGELRDLADFTLVERLRARLG